MENQHQPPKAKFSVAKLLGLWNPWTAWANSPTREQVARALAYNHLSDKPTPAGATAAQHAARIAYLVCFPAPDPIKIEYGTFFEVYDGNHRLCAADYAGLPSIQAEWGGFQDLIEGLLFKT